MARDITKHKYYCELGEKVCGNFKKMGHPCKESCKKEKYMYMALYEDQIDCDYPFSEAEVRKVVGRDFLSFMFMSGLMR